MPRVDSSPSPAASTPVWSWSDIDWTGYKQPRAKKPTAAARTVPLQALPSPTPPPAPSQSIQKPAARAAALPCPEPAQTPPAAAPRPLKPSGSSLLLRPFRTAQEALYWAVSSPERAYPERAARPSDIFAALGRLHRQRRMSREHIRVLGIWAPLGHPPAATRGVERRLWDEAVERLGAALRGVGIVA